ADAGAALDAEALDGEFAALEADAARALDAEDVPSHRRALERTCALRYRGQSFELTVAAEGDLVAAFHAAHEARYGYALPGRPVELVAARLRAVGRAEPVARRRARRRGGAPRLAHPRRAPRRARADRRVLGHHLPRSRRARAGPRQRRAARHPRIAIGWDRSITAALRAQAGMDAAPRKSPLPFSLRRVHARLRAPFRCRGANS